MEQPKARLTLQQHQQAINEAIWIDASPHEWPTVDKMWLLCSALIDSVQMVDYLRIRLAEAEAERDAARAGEARAVEALRRCYEGAARQLAEPRDHDDDQYALTAIATECDAVLAAQGPAIDWMAQQRREAVAAWIEKEATKCRKQNGEYYDRGVDCMLREAAALRAGEVGND